MSQFQLVQSERKLDIAWLVEQLAADGLISQEAAAETKRLPRTTVQLKMHPITYVAHRNLERADDPHKTLDADTIVEWLGKRVHQPKFVIDPLKINVASVTEVMSYAFAQRHNILCVEATPEKVVIATAEPFVSEWEQNVEHVVRRPIRRVLVDPADLNRYTVEFYTMATAVRRATSPENKTSGITNFEQLLELGDLKDPDANDQHIVNIVDWLLQYAFDQRASDIHIEPRREQGHVRFRIDGVLNNVYDLPIQVSTAVTSRLKILSRMNVAEKRRPQDGRIKTLTPQGTEVELRLSTLPTAFGEKLVMRIFDPEVLVRSFEQLGLTSDDYERWQNMIYKPHGIVLVTGPTGSGKTTTLYSSLKQLATPEVNVCTIEDPIEMVEPAFNQMQVQHNIDLDFAAGVRSLMRQDPDIIMVGEIRDLETAEMAIQAALTGHLVLSTLHTNDAPTAVSRMLELGVPPYLIKATLLGVMAQRLVRTLCPNCKEPAEISPEAWVHLTAPWKVNQPKNTYQPVGCLECRNTGYRGRQGIYEILLMTESIQELVGDRISLPELRRQGIREGMRTLRLSGAQKIAAGATTIEEVLRVAPPPQDK